MEWYQALLFMIGGFLFLVVIGIPLNFALGLAFIPVLYFFSGEPLDYVFDLFGFITFRKLNEHILVALVLFILMGQLFNVTGVGGKMYDGFQRWVGWMPGGLALATIGANTLVAAIVGASLISAATTGPVSIPSMVRYGYNKALAVGSECAGSTLAMLIPPSIPMIFYCVITDQSIGHLFMAGIVPGLIIAAMFTILILVRVKLKPSLAPRIGTVTLKERGQAIPWLAGPLCLILFILGAIYTGIASVNEVAAIGVLGVAILGLFYRELSWRKLLTAMMRASQFIGFFGMIFVCAVFMGFGFAYYGIADALTTWIEGLVVARVVILLILMVLFLLLGMIMTASAVILVSMPFILPVILTLGYDPIWFGVLLILNLEIGAMTPPVGVNLFALKAAIPELDLKDAIFGSLPFIGVICIAMGLLVLFPNLALWLPGTM